jgi:Protein of unknown function (DUF3703)
MAALSLLTGCAHSSMRRKVGTRAAAVSPIDRVVAALPRAGPRAGPSQRVRCPESQGSTVRAQVLTLAGPISTLGRMPLSPPAGAADSSTQRTQVAFAQTRSTDVDQAYAQEVERADQALLQEDFETAFRHLERAHVLAQRKTGRHTFIHWRMLVAGLRRGDLREAVGQVPRLVASILFSRLWVPRGNSGRSRVSAFKPMSVPDDLRHLVP